jgi:hypothetical protein
MESFIQKKLLNNETVLWSGKVVPFKLMEPPYDKKLPTRWIISAIAGVLIIALYLFYTLSNDMDVKIVLIIIIAAIVLFIALRPIIDKSKMEKKFTYVITNLRAVTFSGEDVVQSISFDKIKNVKLDLLSNGAGVILMGEFDEKDVSKAREWAYAGKKNDQNEVLSMSFYSAEDANKAIQFLPRK